MKPILILLPATVYILLTLIFVRKLVFREISDALVKAHLVIFAFIAVSTEFLSLLQALSFPGVLVAWLLFLLVCFVAVILLIYQRNHNLSSALIRKFTPLTAILVGAIAFLLAATFATAIVYPTNNWDSMTYHMPRVVHWISNNNISFFTTAITRQNYQMPLAEFAIMHLQILTGFDLYANLVQWVSFLVLICLGCVTAAELGLNNRQQRISAIVIATLPMAILQASSTQNDLVVSSFVMSFGLFMLRIGKNLSAVDVLLAAISLGLALLTKGTAYLYCAAIGTSLATYVLLKYRSDRARFLKATVALSFVVFVAFALNAGHLSRNYKLYGHPLSTEGENYMNTDMSASALLANITRNCALHLGIPSDRINYYLERAMQVALGSQLNNSKTTWPGTSFRIFWSRHEDLAGNVIHMLIALLSVVLLPILWRQKHHRRAAWYAIGIMFSSVLYCWVLKWQPWASRLHTPLFAMAAPLLAMTITAKTGRIGKRISHGIVLCMVFYSLIFVCANKSRPLVSTHWYGKDRMKLYFVNRPSLFQDYRNAINVVREAAPQEVGMYLDVDDWEYPFWAFAQRTLNNGIAMTFRHVGVNNISRAIEEDTSLPVFVIATKGIDSWKHVLKYTSVYTSSSVSVFKKSVHNNVIPAGDGDNI